MTQNTIRALIRAANTISQLNNAERTRLLGDARQTLRAYDDDFNGNRFLTIRRSPAVDFYLTCDALNVSDDRVMRSAFLNAAKIIRELRIEATTATSARFGSF
jgi:hypothetical protein